MTPAAYVRYLKSVAKALAPHGFTVTERPRLSDGYMPTAWLRLAKTDTLGAEVHLSQHETWFVPPNAILYRLRDSEHRWAPWTRNQWAAQDTSPDDLAKLILALLEERKPDDAIAA